MTTIVFATAVVAAFSGIIVLARGLAVGSGWLLVAAGVTLPAWVVSQPASAVPFTLALLVGGLPPVLAAAAGVVWPTAPLGRAGRAVIVAVLACASVSGLLPTLLFDPVAAGCNACPPNLFEVYPADAASTALSRLAAGLTLLWAPALAGLAIHRWVRAPALGRLHDWPQLAGGGGIAVLVAAAAAWGLGQPVGEIDPAAQGIQLVQCGLIAVVAAGGAARVYRARTAGRRMARVVLAAIPDPAAVIRSLRDTIADPTLTVGYRRADGTMIDPADGNNDSGGDRAVLRLSRDRTVFAEICYDPRLAGSLDLIRTSATSAGLALEYLAAQARLRAELRDAAAVRERIVATGDAERQRLERNLHDGAQQRLIALGLMLSTSAPAAHAELDTALDELRTVARGLFPTSLREAGVHAALRELGDHTAAPLVVTGLVADHLPLPVGMAVYQLVSDAAREVPADSPLVVDLNGGGAGPVRVTITATPLDPGGMAQRLLYAEDRFVAAGGELRIVSTADGLIIEGTAPCGS